MEVWAVFGSSTEDWTAIGAWGQWFAGIVALIFLLYTYWHQTWRSPKLRLDFLPDQDVKTQTNTVNPPHGIVISPEKKSRWLRVRVKNVENRRAAKNCRAYLIGINLVRPDGTLEDRFPNDVRPMVWMHEPTGKPAGPDLLPGVTHWADVVFAIEGESVLHTSVEPPYPLNETGEYVFTVQVSAEEVSPQVVTIRVHWDGNWHSLRGQKFTNYPSFFSGKYSYRLREVIRRFWSCLSELSGTESLPRPRSCPKRKGPGTARR
jgi:hypothetical protein